MRGMAVNTPTTGAIVRDGRGRFAPGTTGIGQPITADNSRAMLERRRDKKRDVIQRAANQAVQSNTVRGEFGGEAWIAEIASVQMMIATTPDAGQAATKAADWLINNAGIGERQRDEGGAVSAVVHTIDPQVVALLAQIAEQQNAFDNSNYHNHVVEGESSDIQDTEGEQGEGG
jgi:hypothetical protein